MQTHLADWIKDTPEGREADAILRKCVHCGFCLATCPTYNLLGDELDSPRGRIYLMKQALEGAPVTASTRLHLDRCLTCRACETTCPSGVQYGRLVDIGRELVEKKAPRGAAENAYRALLRFAFLSGPVFKAGIAMGRLFKPLLPGKLAKQVPPERKAGPWPGARHERRMIVLDGCVQPALAPDINAATARVLDRLGISLVSVPQAGCCGAIRTHLSDVEGGLADMRRNIDAWWPLVNGLTSEGRVEAIVMNASGCGVTVKDYGHALAHDPDYADKAQRVSALTRDLCELLPDLVAPLKARLRKSRDGQRLAFHPPCTLQHGQQLRGVVERHLGELGFDVQLAATDSHLCCGSAGTYSVLQPELAYQLRDRKLTSLAAVDAPLIVSANIGCIQHLQSGTSTPVRHWVEVLDEALA